MLGHVKFNILKGIFPKKETKPLSNFVQIVTLSTTFVVLCILDYHK